MKSNIALIGFMATGKSAVGRLLAERLGKQPVELDAYIEQKAGRPIPEIFAQDGEAAFRKLEIGAVAEVAAGSHQVIACGGGVVLNKVNIDRLKRNGVIVCLTAAPEVILQRASADDTVRPLLAGKDKDQAIRELLALRQPLYQQAADILLDTSDLDIGEVVEQIIAGLEEHAGKDK